MGSPLQRLVMPYLVPPQDTPSPGISTFLRNVMSA